METKICRKCKREFPATTEYFYKDNNVKCGLRSRCKECDIKSKRSTMKKYYENNKEKIAEYQKEYKKNNFERFDRYKKRYKKPRKIRIRQFTKKDIRNILNQKYIARKKNLESTLTTLDWEEIKKDFKNECAYCGEKTSLEIEHIIPVSKGGGLTKSNIIPSCKKCNINKGNKNFIKWYRNKNFYSQEREKKILNILTEKERNKLLNEFNSGVALKKYYIKKIQTRKEHICDKCNAKINVGEYAFKSMYSYNGIKIDYTCVKCMNDN
jgi:5-methylcytosine-specific restriction endonuclease McrA